jgi:hypothetical protein
VGERILALQPGVPDPIARILEAVTQALPVTIAENLVT